MLVIDSSEARFIQEIYPWCNCCSLCISVASWITRSDATFGRSSPQYSSGNGELFIMKTRRVAHVLTCVFSLRIPQYPFPLLTAISVICLADNGRSAFIRNLFGAGSSNEGLGLFSFSTSWNLITQGNPLIWPLQTRKWQRQHSAQLTHFPSEINSFSTLF